MAVGLRRELGNVGSRGTGLVAEAPPHRLRQHMPKSHGIRVAVHGGILARADEVVGSLLKIQQRRGIQVEEPNLPQDVVVLRHCGLRLKQILERVVIQVRIAARVLEELQPPFDIRMTLLLAVGNAEQLRDVLLQLIAEALLLKLEGESGIDAHEQFVGLLHALVKLPELLVGEGQQAVALGLLHCQPAHFIGHRHQAVLHAREAVRQGSVDAARGIVQSLQLLVAGALQEAADGVSGVFGQRCVAEVVEPVFPRADGIAAVGVVVSQRARVAGE